MCPDANQDVKNILKTLKMKRTPKLTEVFLTKKHLISHAKSFVSTNFSKKFQFYSKKQIKSHFTSLKIILNKFYEPILIKNDSYKILMMTKRIKI